MNLREEIRTDTLEISDRLLSELAGVTPDNDTPEGRLVFQLKWLKEKAETKGLPFPFRDKAETLWYIATERLLRPLAASEPEHFLRFDQDLYRLMSLSKGDALTKREFFPAAFRYTEVYRAILENADRPIAQVEWQAASEIEAICDDIAKDVVHPPLIRIHKWSPSFRKVYSITGSTLDDQPHGKQVMRQIANLFFNGVRPDAWTNVDEANRAVDDLMKSVASR